MPTIDERVVQMSFDNQQFERGVSKSMGTLEKLKQSLKFDDLGNSIKNIEVVTNSLNSSLESIKNQVEGVANVFTPLGQLGQTAIRKISDAAIDAGKNIFNMVSGLNNIKAGEQKYQTRTKAVQTITNATGKSVAEVEKILDRLQKYTDETSADFTEMVQSIGKFTSVGVELSVAEKAMEGISNEAYKSGASRVEAARAMYNFAQALSTGSVKLMDWRSIANANMATKEFKEELIKTAIELGTISKKSETVGTIMKQTKKATKKAAAEFKETVVDYKTFDHTLSEGWLTSDVLIKTLNRYADTNTEIGRTAYQAAKEYLTFGDVMDTIADTVSSGWMRTWQAIFGNLDEARSLWTRVGDSIVDLYSVFSDYRVELVQSWHEMGGYTTAIEAASNIWHTFADIVLGVKEAFEQIVPLPTAEQFVKATEKIRDASAKLRESFHLSDEWDYEEDYTKTVDSAKELNKVLKRGAKNKYVKTLQESLIANGYLLDKANATGTFGPETEAAVKKLQKELGVKVTGAWDEVTRKAAINKKAMIDQVTYTETVTRTTKEASGPMKRLQAIVRGVASAAKIVVSFIKAGRSVAKSIIKIFNPIAKVAIRFLSLVSDMLQNLAKNLENNQVLNKWVKNVERRIGPIYNLIEKLAKLLDSFISSYAKFLDAKKLENSFSNFFKYLETYIKRNTPFGFIVDIVDGVVKAIGFAKDSIQNFANAIKKRFATIFSELKKVKTVDDLLALIEKYLQKIPVIGELISKLNGKGLINLKNGLVDFATAISNSFKSKSIGPLIDYFKGLWKAFRKSIEGSMLDDFITNLGKAIRIVSELLSGLYTILFDGFGKIGKGLKNFIDKWKWISSFDQFLFMIEYYLQKIPVLGQLIQKFNGNGLITLKNIIVGFAISIVAAFKQRNLEPVFNYFSILWKIFRNAIKGSPLDKFVDHVEKVINGLIAFLKWAFSSILDIVGGISKSINKFLDAWGWISDLDQLLFVLEYFLSKVPILGILFRDAEGSFNGNKLVSIKNAITDFVETVRKAFKNGDIRSVKDFFNVLWGSFKKVVKGSPLQGVADRVEYIVTTIMKVLGNVVEGIEHIGRIVYSKLAYFIKEWGWIADLDQLLLSIEYFLSKIPIIGILFKDAEGAFNGDKLIGIKNIILDFINGIGQALRNGEINSVSDVFTVIWESLKNAVKGTAVEGLFDILDSSIKNIINIIFDLRDALENIVTFVYGKVSRFIEDWKWVSDIDQLLFSIEYFLSKIPIIGQLFKGANGAFDGNIFIGIKDGIVEFITAINAALKTGNIDTILIQLDKYLSKIPIIGRFFTSFPKVQIFDPTAVSKLLAFKNAIVDTIKAIDESYIITDVLNMFGEIISAADSFTNTILSIISPLKQLLTEGYRDSNKEFNSIFNDLFNGSDIRTILSNLKEITTSITLFFTNLKNAFDSINDILKSDEPLPNMIESISGVFSVFYKYNVEMPFEAFNKRMKNAFDKNITEPLKIFRKDANDSFDKYIFEPFGIIRDKATKTFKNVFEPINPETRLFGAKEVFVTFYNVVSEIGTLLANVFSTVHDVISNGLSGFASLDKLSLVTGAITLFTGLLTVIRNFLAAINDSDLVNDLGRILSSVITVITDFSKMVYNTLYMLFYEGSYTSGFKTFVGNISRFVDDVATKLELFVGNFKKFRESASISGKTTFEVFYDYLKSISKDNNIVNYFVSLVDVIGSAWKIVSNLISRIYNSIFNKGIPATAGNIFDSIVGILTNFNESITSILTSLSKSDFIQSLLDAGSTIGRILSTFAEMITGGISRITSVGTSITKDNKLTNIFDTVTKTVDNFSKAINKFLDGYESFLKKTKKTNSIGSFVSYFMDNIKDVLGIGKFLGEGLEKGTEKQKGGIIQAVIDIAKGMYDAICKFLGIQSPSKKFMYIGAMCVLGLIAGIASGFLGGTGKISEILGNFGEYVKNTFSLLSPIFGGLARGIGDLFKKIGDSIKKYDVKSIPDFFAAIWNGIITELPIVGRIVNSIGPIISGLFDAILGSLKSISESFKGKEINSFGDFFRILGDGFKSLFNFKGGGNSPIIKFFGRIVNIFEKLTGTDSPVLNAIAGITNFISRLRILGSLEGIIEKIKGIIENVLGEINNLLSPESYGRKGMTKSAYEERKKALMDRVKDISGMLMKLVWPAIAAVAVKAIANVSGSIKDLISIAKVKSGVKSDTIGDTILKIVGAFALLGGIVAVLAMLDPSKVAYALGVVQTLIVDLALMAGILVALDAVKSKFKITENVGLELLELVGSIAALAIGLMLLTAAFKYMGKNIGAAVAGIIMLIGLLAAFSALELALAWIASKGDTGKAEVAIKGIFDMCKGLLITVVAFGALAFILSHTSFGTALGTLAIMITFLGSLGVLMAFLADMARQSPDGELTVAIKGFIPLALALLGTVLAFGEVALAIKMFGGAAAFGAFLIVEAFMASLAAIALLFQKMTDDPKEAAKKSLALAISVLSIAASLMLIGSTLTELTNSLRKVPVGNAIAEFAGIFLILSAMGAIAILFQKFGTSGTDGLLQSAALAIAMIGMAFAISIIAGALGDAAKKIQNVPWQNLLVFFGAVELIILTLGGLAMLLRETGVMSLISVGAGLAAALALLGIGLAVFGTFASFGIEDAAQALWILGSDLGMFSDMISNMDWDNIRNVVTFMSVDLLNMWGSISGIDFVTFLDKVTKLTSVGGQLSLFANSISSITQEVLDASSRAISVLDNAKQIAATASEIVIPDVISKGYLTTFGASLLNYANDIIVVGNAGAQSESAKTVATDAKEISDTIAGIDTIDAAKSALTNLGSALNLYYGMLSDISTDEDGNVSVPTVDSKMISQAFTALTEAIPEEQISMIASYASGGDNDMTTVALGINALGEALGNYGTNIGTLESDNVESANTILGTLASLELSLNPRDVFGNLVGNDGAKTFGSFADDITALGGALKAYGDDIGGLTETSVSNANSVISQLLGLHTILNEDNKGIDITNLFSFLKGKQETMTSFSGDVKVLGDALGSYATNIGTLNKDQIELANTVIESTLNTAKNLPTTGGFISKLIGGQNLGSFASNMGNLGDGVRQYADKISGASFNNITQSSNFIEKIVGILSNLEKSGGIASWFTGEKNIGKVANGLSDLGSELSAFSTNAKDVNYADVTAALDIVEKVVNWSDKLNEASVYDATTGFQMSTFDFINQKIPEVLKSISNLDELKNDDSVSIIASLIEIGKKVSEAIAAGITDETKTAEAEGAVSSLMTSLGETVKGFYDEFYDIGTYIIDGFIAGLNDKQKLEELRAAGDNLGQTPTTATQKVVEVNSPSAKFAWIGQMCALGLKNGLNDYSYLVTDAGLDLGKASLLEIMAAFDQHNLKNVSKGALESISSLLIRPDDYKYTKDDKKIIKQILVATGYLNEANWNDSEVVRDAVRTFKTEILGREGKVDGTWRSEDSRDLYESLMLTLDSNEYGYEQIRYESEMLEALGIQYGITGAKAKESAKDVEKAAQESIKAEKKKSSAILEQQKLLEKAGYLRKGGYVSGKEDLATRTAIERLMVDLYKTHNVFDDRNAYYSNGKWFDIVSKDIEKLGGLDKLLESKIGTTKRPKEYLDEMDKYIEKKKPYYEEYVAKTKVNKAKQINSFLKSGSTGEEVKTLQKSLVDTGYLLDASIADGVYGPETKEAVKKLQSDLGVAVTGNWDKTTQKAVIASRMFFKDTGKQSVEDENKQQKNRKKKKKKTSENTATKGYSADGFLTLPKQDSKNIKTSSKESTEQTELQKKLLEASKMQVGSTGENVKLLQTWLNKQDSTLNKLAVNGIFESKTEAALKAFQESIGVKQTGVFDDLLKNAIDVRKEEKSNTKEVSSNKSKKELAKERRMALKDEDSSSINNYRKNVRSILNDNLKVGDKGNSVKALQRILNSNLSSELGEKLVVDGIFGPKTEAALKKLQEKFGRDVTGVWGGEIRDLFTQNEWYRTERDKKKKEETKKNNQDKNNISSIFGSSLQADWKNPVFSPEQTANELSTALTKVLGGNGEGSIVDIAKTSIEGEGGIGSVLKGTLESAITGEGEDSLLNLAKSAIEGEGGIGSILSSTITGLFSTESSEAGSIIGTLLGCFKTGAFDGIKDGITSLFDVEGAGKESINTINSFVKTGFIGGITDAITNVFNPDSENSLIGVITRFITSVINSFNPTSNEDGNAQTNTTLDSTKRYRPVIDGNASTEDPIASGFKSAMNSEGSPILAASTSLSSVQTIASSIQSDTSLFKSQLDTSEKKIVDEFKSLNTHIDTLEKDILNMKIYLDSTAIVAGTVSKMDAALGQRMFNAGGRRRTK